MMRLIILTTNTETLYHFLLTKLWLQQLLLMKG